MINDMESAIKTLYVVGNGFDMHHGIKSSYWNYMKWLEANYPELFKEIEQTFRGATEESWWADFENGLEKVDWFYNINNTTTKSEYQVGDVEIAGKKSSQRLLKLYDAIQVTFTQWVESLAPQIKAVKPDLDLDSAAMYLNFNYTNTLQDAYQVPDENVLHIHGNALRGDKVIIGHKSNGDQFHIMQAELVDYTSDTINMARAIGRFRKPTGKIIAEHQSFFDSLADVEQVTTCGFSFSSVDMPYVREIMKHIEDKVIWRVYVHFDRDRERMAIVQKDLNITMEFIDW